MAEIDEELEAFKDGGWRQWAAIDAALERGDIDEAGWFRAVGEIITPAYLSTENPRAQSGHSGDARRWEGARRLLLDAVDRDGRFLDVGCANGHLMECVVAWAAEDGVVLDPWGLEISEELAALARERLPHWSDHILVGNALSWRPPLRFDYVRTNLEYVPRLRQPDLVGHLLESVVADKGRLIIGVFNEETDRAACEADVSAWGYTVSGATERRHPETDRVVRRAFWIDAAGR